VKEQPRVSEPAPSFELPSQDGTTVSLEDYRGKKHVVLYFYPKDDTPGCTREACDFRDSRALANEDVVILGVSKDSVQSHARFREKYGLPFRLLSDTDGVAERYGVWKEKHSYGRKSIGIERTTFVIDKQGIVRQVFPRVKVEGHVDEIVAAVKQMDAPKSPPEAER
jgi:peroxiredoxin Q/BCP